MDEAVRLASLSEQLEDLLDQVWVCEADWRFDDRVDFSLKVRRRHSDR